MNKSFIILLLIFHFFSKVIGQSIDIQSINEAGQIKFYASNDFFVAQQCQIYIDVKHTLVAFAAANRAYYFVIPPNTQQLWLFSITIPENTQLAYHSDCLIGNPLTVKPDTGAVYLLPFDNKTGHWIIQGYNGKYSHQKQFALDFKMKIGTPLHATRDGVVVKIKEDSDQGGKSSSFSKMANSIMIMHADGTFSYYLHLKHQGSEVAVGDTVKAGQLIGYSGNTGWSTTPHLHFEVRKPVYMSYESIPTRFQIRKRSKILKPLRHYRAVKKK
jgi:murein DD-endopeptidase MepM/ murein hydrolase activator NlpD